ncbi:MAG: 30S ribosomal protein S10 [Methylacidiphilales bacterium]|nr:30S ribosomal protein S10 [Candidatus Methylacidiphilales bacterium]
MNKQNVKLRLQSYDHRILDSSVKEIIDTVKRTGARVRGPVPLPRTIERFTILTSPHIDKDARDQYEIRTYSRIIYIIEPTDKTMDALNRLALAVGVSIDIKLTG